VVSHGDADGWSWVFGRSMRSMPTRPYLSFSTNAANSLEFSLAPRRIDELAMFSDGIERMCCTGQVRPERPFFDRCSFQ